MQDAIFKIGTDNGVLDAFSTNSIEDVRIFKHLFRGIAISDELPKIFSKIPSLFAEFTGFAYSQPVSGVYNEDFAAAFFRWFKNFLQDKEAIPTIWVKCYDLCLAFELSADGTWVYVGTTYPSQSSSLITHLIETDYDMLNFIE